MVSTNASIPRHVPSATSITVKKKTPETLAAMDHLLGNPWLAMQMYPINGCEPLGLSLAPPLGFLHPAQMWKVSLIVASCFLFLVPRSVSQPLPGILHGIPDPVDHSSINPADASDSLPTSPHGDEMEVDDVSPVETEGSDADPAVDIITPSHHDAEPRTPAVERAHTIVTASGVTDTAPLLRSSVTASSDSPPQTSLNEIDVERIPTFLRRHGKGKRQVDIFGYLNEVKDPRFKNVLLHYIRIEVNGTSGAKEALATTKRPLEISQWSSRARPACIPEFTKGKRTFSDFVDSVFVWWGLIQPPWRLFERGQVSREVGGAWDTLYATGTNGLLNVVILVYWWARVLEEQAPQDSFRVDYEMFADDVAWVFSNVSA